MSDAVLLIIIFTVIIVSMFLFFLTLMWLNLPPKHKQISDQNYEKKRRERIKFIKEHGVSKATKKYGRLLSSEVEEANKTIFTKVKEKFLYFLAILTGSLLGLFGC